MIPPLIVWICADCGHVDRVERRSCDLCTVGSPKPAALIPLADDWEPPMVEPEYR